MATPPLGRPTIAVIAALSAARAGWQSARVAGRSRRRHVPQPDPLRRLLRSRRHPRRRRLLPDRVELHRGARHSRSSTRATSSTGRSSVTRCRGSCPEDAFAPPQHGGGVWAPAIRHHDGRFWIYYPDPDRGIYVTTATDPRGPWSAPVLVKGGKGLIDPCPLWDDDGHVYLVHAWAEAAPGSRTS